MNVCAWGEGRVCLFVSVLVSARERERDGGREGRREKGVGKKERE